RRYSSLNQEAILRCRRRIRTFSSGAPSESNIGTHVEGHGIQKMWEIGAKKAVIVVGSEPCGICSRNIPAALPKGAQLLIIHPDAINPGTWTRTWFRCLPLWS